jgi:hypothetical protein
MSLRRYGVDKSLGVPPDLTDPALRTPEGKTQWQAQLQKAFAIAFNPKGPYLLGIDWCHLNNLIPVINQDGKQVEGMKVRENTGMAGVVPAWKIMEVINAEELIVARNISEKDWIERMATSA